MKKNERTSSKVQQQLHPSSAEGQPPTDGTPLETVSDTNQDVLEEALEMVQGGIGLDVGLGILKKDIRSLTRSKTGKTGDPDKCDTGRNCDNTDYCYRGV